MTLRQATPDTDQAGLKPQVAEFWDRNPCGMFSSEEQPGEKAFFDQVAAYRDAAQPFMDELMNFRRFAGRRVLEVGCGLGTDLRQLALAGAQVVGVDLSARSVALARRHFWVFSDDGAFINADAEHLPFADESFDLVYSFGFLHHTPNTKSAIAECGRVLKPNGNLIIMLYNKHSWHVVVEPYLFAAKRWLLRQPLPRGFADRREVVRRYDGSNNPLGKAFTRAEVRHMLAGLDVVRMEVRHPRTVGAGGLTAAYYWLLEAVGITHRWGFWIIAQARKPVARHGSSQP